MLISIEIMLLAITFLILIASLNFDDILGQIYATYIISIAKASNNLVHIQLFRWLDSESLNIICGFDCLTVSMIISLCLYLAIYPY